MKIGILVSIYHSAAVISTVKDGGYTHTHTLLDTWYLTTHSVTNKQNMHSKMTTMNEVAGSIPCV